MESGGTPLVDFDFDKQYVVDPGHQIIIESIRISIPASDTAFTSKNDKEHNFYYYYRNSKSGNTNRKEKIDSGEIRGTLIAKDVWEIEVKMERFKFRKLISSKGNYNSYFDKIILN